jgi:hypothetical protein
MSWESDVAYFNDGLDKHGDKTFLHIGNESLVKKILKKDGMTVANTLA